MRRLILAVLAAGLLAPGSASALPVGGVTLPVFRSQVPAGGGTTVRLRPAFDPPRRAQGQLGDWTGSLPGFGGATFYSRGELVYQDHIFDAYGPDNGQDAGR